MDRDYFIITERLGFSRWGKDDSELARTLWGDARVTKYICASGHFSDADITARLALEISNGEAFHIQYWPIFELASGEFVGCCGLRPHKEGEYELGFHLRPEFWGQGLAREAAEAVIAYAFRELHTKALFAGHNPNNIASRRLLFKLGFEYVADEFYAPTGLFHPSYVLREPLIKSMRTP